MDHHVYRRADLLAHGYRDRQIRDALDAGVLHRVRSGWYADRSADPEVVAAVRRGGALGCVSALSKHQVWVAPGYPDLHVRAGKYSRSMADGFCSGFGGPLPVTKAVDDVPLALMYAARCMTREHWIAAADSVMNSRRISADELRFRMGHIPSPVADWMRACDARSQSGTESIVRTRLRNRGFHVVVQPRIESIGGYADLRIGRLLIECDSRLHHTSPENYRKDRRRDRKSLAGRWMTMRLTYDDVLFGWDEALADICTATDAGRHRIRKVRPK